MRKWMWLFAAATAVFIFYFSAQPAATSGEASGTVTEKLLSFFPSVRQMPAQQRFELVEQMDFFVRKGAHFSIYAALGFFVMMALSGHKLTLARAFALALGLCLLYAVTDEIHQLFVPGRSGQLSDVLLDFSGSAIAAAVVLAVLSRIRHREKRENRDV